MSNNHTHKLLERINSDTFLNMKCREGIIYDTRMIIVQCIETRRINKITQNDMAKRCGVSLATIKRFEALKVDSLSLFIKYRYILENLPAREKRNIPKWVYRK